MAMKLAAEQEAAVPRTADLPLGPRHAGAAVEIEALYGRRPRSEFAGCLP